MSNELVKYQPELNTIPLRKFSPVEMNLFFSIVSRMRDKGDQTVRFSFDQLKELSNYKPTANRRFIDDIKRTYDHLMDLRFGSQSKSGLSFERFVMFTKFKINGDVDEPYVDVEIYKDALPLLNNLESWVRYALIEFRDLKSSYAKTMFRLLKGYRTTGYAYFSKADFDELLDIPKTYRQGDINKKVIKPIKEELTPLFRGLTVRKKYGKGRGKPVIGYSFAWKPERKDAEDVHVSKTERLKTAKFNIEHNGELSDKEKWRAIDKIKGLKLGTTEAEHNKQEQAKREEQIRADERKKTLEELRKGWH
ncbi:MULTISPECIES: replication initiation protein [Lactobacillaceae]|uniref:replication initiation protein n=1 Tax=Lactobacillaceae TaxID=33958 RepID=UPI00066550F5|nr:MULTISPECIES: replication initiation protein [Lactobacillaceae]KZU55457.1 Plasmid replication initiation protein [Lactiplantibacillus plantarum]RND75015.1 Protein involved in initiation of plasmid replication [Lacticaseibacillus paracasei]HAQ5015709.1 replication initiation protein [Enterococcus faecium]